MRVKFCALFFATVLAVASCQTNADNTDREWKPSTNTHGRSAKHAHVSKIIEQYLLDTQALETFLEMKLDIKKKHNLHNVKKLFASHLASNVPQMNHLKFLPMNAHDQNRFRHSRTDLSKVEKARLRYNKLLTLSPYGLAAEPGTEFWDQVSAMGEQSKGCRKKANKYRKACLHGGGVRI